MNQKITRREAIKSGMGLCAATATAAVALPVDQASASQQRRRVARAILIVTDVVSLGMDHLDRFSLSFNGVAVTILTADDDMQQFTLDVAVPFDDDVSKVNEAIVDAVEAEREEVFGPHDRVLVIRGSA